MAHVNAKPIMAEKEPPMIKGKVVAIMSAEIGFSVALTTVAMTLGGRAIDARFGTKPVFILIGMALGLAASLYIVWKIVKSVTPPQP